MKRSIICHTYSFHDAIVLDEFNVGKEHCVPILFDIGGIERAISRLFKSQAQSHVRLNIVGTKRSFILLNGSCKTTFTEKLVPVLLTQSSWDGSISVHLFSYAEDFDWTGSTFSAPQGSIAVCDFSGRYTNYNDVYKVAERLSDAFYFTYLLVTDHDQLSSDQLLELSAFDNVQVIYHSPKEVILVNCGQATSIPNEYYCKFEKDFVGLGDIFALKICVHLSAGNQITVELIKLLQKFIWDLINAEK